MVWVKKTKPEPSSFNVNAEDFVPSGKQVQHMTVQRKDTFVDYSTGQVTTTFTTTTTARIAPKACMYFAAGKCKFGNECYYSHELPTNTIPAPVEPMTSKAKQVIKEHTELEKQYLNATS